MINKQRACRCEGGCALRASCYVLLGLRVRLLRSIYNSDSHQECCRANRNGDHYNLGLLYEKQGDFKNFIMAAYQIGSTT